MEGRLDRLDIVLAFRNSRHCLARYRRQGGLSCVVREGQKSEPMRVLLAMFEGYGLHVHRPRRTGIAVHHSLENPFAWKEA